jgi:hypothetical protein
VVLCGLQIHTALVFEAIRYRELGVKLHRKSAVGRSWPTRHKLRSNRTDSSPRCLIGTLYIAMSIMNAFTAIFSLRETASANLDMKKRCNMVVPVTVIMRLDYMQWPFAPSLITHHISY